MQTPIRVLELLSLKSFSASEIQIALQLDDDAFDKAINRLIALNYTTKNDGCYNITATGKSCISTTNCVDIIWDIEPTDIT